VKYLAVELAEQKAMFPIYTHDYPLPHYDPRRSVPMASLILACLWILPPIIYFCFDRYMRKRRSVVEGVDLELRGTFAVESCVDETNSLTLELEARTEAPTAQTDRLVLYSSVEFKVPGDKQNAAKAMAGGLGKVTDVVARYHPGNLIMVHPMLAPSGKLSYDGLDLYDDDPLEVIVDGTPEKILVHCHSADSRQKGFRVHVCLLDHPLFTKRELSNLYPNPMTRREVLCFWSLWNQAVGKLLVRYKPHIFHCPDFHSAVAPWYAAAEHPDLKVLLVLHNAEYQGSISTDMILDDKLSHVAKVWNLPESVVAKRLVVQGRFNMLKAAVDYLAEKQGGVGACAVSERYAWECFNCLSIFWPLRSIAGLDNPMLEHERPKAGAIDLNRKKRQAKLLVQEKYELQVNPDARIMVFLGRLVRQKGVDIIADVAQRILDDFSDAQLIVIGPPGDGFGSYARRKLENLFNQSKYRDRLYVKCEFMQVGEELKFASDFCLMPSRDEPFGYVDIEFAWHGACMIGAQAGGLGKVPGFYYVAQNRDNIPRLCEEFFKAIEVAIRCPAEKLDEMSIRATKTFFPLDRWQQQMVKLYEQLGCPMDRRSSPNFTGRERACFKFNQPALVYEEAQEFLSQELSEKELTEQINVLLDAQTDWNMNQILDAIGYGLDLDREAKAGSGGLSQFLLRRFFGVPLVHILVSIGYVSSSIMSVLTVVVANQWAVRSPAIGGIGRWVPEWAYPALLFSMQGLGFSIGVVIWAALSKRFPPRILLGTNMLLRIPLLVGIAPVQPTVGGAVLLSLAGGFVVSGSLLFIVFNFMMSIVSDFAEIAIRMGMLEMCRYMIQWLVMAYMFGISPSSIQGVKGEPITSKLTFALLPLAFIGFFVDLVPGVLLFFSPGPYRDDRFPGWEVGGILKKKSFLFLALSDLLGALVSFPASWYVLWWLYNGWTTGELAKMSILVGLVCAVGMLIWAMLLHYLTRHGQSVVVPVALLLAPPTILQVLVQAQVSSMFSLGASNYAMIVSVYALMLEGVRLSTFWIARIKILKDRWKLLSYATGLLSLISLCQFLSPFVCEGLAAANLDTTVTFASADDWGLARTIIKVMVWPAPIALLQFLAQMLAAPWITNDMEIAVGANDEIHSYSWKLLQRWKVGIVPIFGVLGLTSMAIVCATTRKSSDQPEIFSPAWPCKTMTPTVPACQVIWQKMDENETIARFNHDGFGLNRFQQNTTARANCFANMQKHAHTGANTFAVTNGECRVMACSEDAVPSLANASATTPDHSGPWRIFSSLCPYTDTEVIGVQMFEWPWDDIATECEVFLGPAGFNVVQVSPPTEHVVGTDWSRRYQPVSYKFASRSGDEEQFKQMVARCRTAGVAVMVDAVINHMATTHLTGDSECRGDECRGSGGNIYKSREFAGNGPDQISPDDASPEMAVYTPFMFHHYQNEVRSNCGWPPYTNDRYLCDMVSLPDLATESLSTQTMILRYLFGLFEIGVTHLRVDAASNMYTQSINSIINQIPWDYVVQEFYGNDLEQNIQALRIGHVTDFDYGLFMAQGGKILDSWNGDRFEDSSHKFQDLLAQGIDPMPRPRTDINQGLLFLANHDLQRERWKQPDPPDYCTNTDHGPGNNKCAFIYKHGQQYNLAQLFMLAWPRGNNLRLISTYAFFEFHQGPPLESNSQDPNNSMSLPVEVKPNGEYPAKCKITPTHSPVNLSWDNDTDRPWVCEHRWDGVAGMVQFRRAISNYTLVHVVARLKDKKGHLGYSIGDAAFVALSRGYNWLTEHGPNASLNLTKPDKEIWYTKDHLPYTGMPEGEYCNMAAINSPDETTTCGGTSDWHRISVNINGTIVKGRLLSGRIVAIHVDFPAPKPGVNDNDSAPTSNDDMELVTDKTSLQSAWQDEVTV
jgi:glycogen synthase/glycosidase